MPQGRGLYLRVGVLVVAGIALALGFVLFLTASRLSGAAALFETYSRESVQGLEVGAPVRYRGVSVGRVTEIGLVSAEYSRPMGDPFGPAFQLVMLRFAVDPGRIGETPSVEDAVRLGLRVRIAAQGITGVNYLELDFIDPDRYAAPLTPPWRPRYAYIPSVPSTVAQVQNAAETLLAQVETLNLPVLVADIAGIASDLRKQFRDGELSAALRDAAALMRSLREASEAADLPATLAELRGVAAEARGLIGGRELRLALANVGAAAAALRVATARLPDSIGQLDAGLRSARGTATDVQAELGPLLRDLRIAIANLRDTTEQLRRSPSQALLGAPPPAPAEPRSPGAIDRLFGRSGSAPR